MDLLTVPLANAAQALSHQALDFQAPPTRHPFTGHPLTMMKERSWLLAAIATVVPTAESREYDLRGSLWSGIDQAGHMELFSEFAHAFQACTGRVHLHHGMGPSLSPPSHAALTADTHGGQQGRTAHVRLHCSLSPCAVGCPRSADQHA